MIIVSMADSERAKNAFHEAGHYVMGYRCKLPLCGIIMLPTNASYLAGVETAGLQEWTTPPAAPSGLRG